MIHMKRLLVPIGVSLLIAGCSANAATQATQATESNKIAQSQQVDYAFTQAQQHPDKKLIEVIDSAKSTLDIAIYSLTKPEIVKAIENAKQRGVNVRIITDHQEASTKAQSQALKMLREKGIPIKENTHKGLMHLKVTIADKSTVTTGSYNYTNAASTYNDEVLVVIHDANMAKAWDDQFERMWNDTNNFTDVK
jgi:phosphatidylserine/phosphatidylglycerophosphate/cardiolipin synthase-like enzyme